MRKHVGFGIVVAIGVCWTPQTVLSSEPSEGISIADAQVTLIGEVRLPARASGALSNMRVREGDVVESGAIVAGIENDLARLQEQAARSEYDVASKQAENDVDERFAVKSIEVAEAELRRAKESIRVAPKSISKTELERLQLVVERTKLTAEQARRDREVAVLTAQTKKAHWDAAQTHVQRCLIVASCNGMVVEILRRPGEWLNPGDPVLRLIQLDRLRVEAFIGDQTSGVALKGRPVTLTVRSLDGKEVDYSGRVVFISPEVQPVTRQVQVWAEVENPKLKLRPGERGQLRIMPFTDKAGDPKESTNLSN